MVSEQLPDCENSLWMVLGANTRLMPWHSRCRGRGLVEPDEPCIIVMGLQCLRELIGATVVKMNEDGKQPGMEQLEETALIKAFLAGDRSAFDKLVLCHQDRVFNVCYRLLGDHEDAGDCAQETFVKVYRSLKGFRFGSSFSTWLYAIAVNTCKNMLKSGEYRRRRKMIPIDEPPQDSDGGRPARQIEDPAPSALTQLTTKERERLLQGAIDDLSPDAKTVVVLRDVEGLTYEEILQATGYNMGTLKSKLARARQQLREKLKGVI